MSFLRGLFAEEIKPSQKTLYLLPGEFNPNVISWWAGLDLRPRSPEVSLGLPPKLTLFEKRKTYGKTNQRNQGDYLKNEKLNNKYCTHGGGNNVLEYLEKPYFWLHQLFLRYSLFLVICFPANQAWFSIALPDALSFIILRHSNSAQISLSTEWRPTTIKENRSLSCPLLSKYLHHLYVFFKTLSHLLFFKETSIPTGCRR